MSLIFILDQATQILVNRLKDLVTVQLWYRAIVVSSGWMYLD